MPRDSGRSRYHPIEDGLWCDEKFDANNGMPEAPFLTRAFFAFLASNRLQRPSGIYRATIRELAASSRLPDKEVIPLLNELERRELVVRDRSWLFLPGYLRRQAHNPSVLSAVRANLSSCSSIIIIDSFKKEYPLFSSMCPTVEPPSTDGSYNVSTPTVPTGPQVPVPEQYQSREEVLRSLSSPDSANPNSWPSVFYLVKLYNDLTPDNVPSVEKIPAGSSRYKKAKQYLRIFPEEDFWRRVFQQYHRSDFLSGKSPPREGHGNFKPDFDWLLSKGKDGSENCLKVHDGRYTDGKT